MKIGIIVHSYTGNTLEVANRLKNELISSGHSANIEQVSAYNEDRLVPQNIKLKTIPDTSLYDILIFGAPVQGFRLSPVMKTYLSQLPSLKDKKVGCFVTQFFPFKWMGGNNTIKYIKKECKSKDVIPFDTGIINWSHSKREKKISEVLKKMTKF